MDPFYIELIGYLASLGVIIGFTPQTIKVIRTRQTRDIALSGYCVLFVSACLWTAYGFLLDPISWPIILTNVFAGSLQLTTIIMKLRYG